MNDDIANALSVHINNVLEGVHGKKVPFLLLSLTPDNGLSLQSNQPHKASAALAELALNAICNRAEIDEIVENRKKNER